MLEWLREYVVAPDIHNPTTHIALVSALLGGFVFTVGPRLFRRVLFRRRKSSGRLIKKDFVTDVVYVYEFPYFDTALQLSPFCLKLTTWLRLRQIKHVSVRKPQLFSAKGQIPFVEFNGVSIADSNIIIDRLSDHFGVGGRSLDTRNSDEASRAIGHPIEVMLDNHTVWSYVYHRYVVAIDEFATHWKLFGALKCWLFRRFAPGIVKKRLFNHGIGRHSPQEISQFGNRDIKALSVLLGEKAYLLGDEMDTVDCFAFGHLVQLLYIPVGNPQHDFIKRDCGNLVTYVERIRVALWPDWEDLIAKAAYKSTD